MSFGHRKAVAGPGMEGERGDALKTPVARSSEYPDGIFATGLYPRPPARGGAASALNS